MAPLRSLCLCLCLSVLLLSPSAAAPALTPARTPGTDWVACKSLSRELSQQLGTLNEPHPVLDGVRLGGEDLEGDCDPRIRCSDACDPSALDTNNTRCLQRILQGLRHYRDLLGSKIFTDRLQQLEATLDRLLGLVQVPGRLCQPPPALTADPWTQPLLRHQALERLRSFAAVMSRVFTHSAR
ncbi:IL23A protein, partial [Alectura lathami]|nr:IL23A protein [Alectura lathami]